MNEFDESDECSIDVHSAKIPKQKKKKEKDKDPPTRIPMIFKLMCDFLYLKLRQHVHVTIIVSFRPSHFVQKKNPPPLQKTPRLGTKLHTQVYNTSEYCILYLHCTILYCTILYYTVLYYTAHKQTGLNTK